MRIIVQAFRAVIVEAIGVIAALWLLFGTATWTANSYQDKLADRPVVPLQIPGAHWGHQAPISSALFNSRPNARTDSRLVAQRLDYYSDYYRNAADDYVTWLTR